MIDACCAGVECIEYAWCMCWFWYGTYDDPFVVLLCVVIVSTVIVLATATHHAMDPPSE